jgi:hypothetical protein
VTRGVKPPEGGGQDRPVAKGAALPFFGKRRASNVSVGHTGHLLGRVQFLSQMLLIEVNAPAFRRQRILLCDVPLLTFGDPCGT